MLDIEIDKKRIITNVRIIPRTINGADYFFRTPKQRSVDEEIANVVYGAVLSELMRDVNPSELFLRSLCLEDISFSNFPRSNTLFLLYETNEKDETDARIGFGEFCSEWEDERTPARAINFSLNINYFPKVFHHAREIFYDFVRERDEKTLDSENGEGITDNVIIPQICLV